MLSLVIRELKYQAMSTSKNTTPMHKGKDIDKRSDRNDLYEEADNLGLDADRSSDDHRSYDNDSDRISHNPDGEEDNRYEIKNGSSPLEDK